MEKFRERLIERHGILAISVLRFYLGTGNIDRERLMKAISRMEIKLEKPELNQVTRKCIFSEYSIQMSKISLSTITF